MQKELKVRIHDCKAVEENLLSLGANFTGEKKVVDTYFNQPEGEVLKLTESAEGDILTHLVSEGGGFKIDKSGKPEIAKEELVKKHGVKAELRKTIRFFALNGQKIGINLIEDVGDFLIVEGENPQKEFIEKTLGIQDPEYITVSFDKLKKKEK